METANRSWTKARLVRILCAAMLLIGTLMLSGCGSSGPDKDLVRWDLSESLSEEFSFLSLTDYSVLQSKTEDRSYSATISVDANSESGYAEFDMIATVEYTKYDQGWDCDSCTWEREDWHVVNLPDEDDVDDLIENRYWSFGARNYGYAYASLEDYTILPGEDPVAEAPADDSESSFDPMDKCAFVCSGRSECWDNNELYHYRYDAKCYWTYNPDADRFEYFGEQFLGNGNLVVFPRNTVDGYCMNRRTLTTIWFSRTINGDDMTIQVKDHSLGQAEPVDATLYLVQPDPNDPDAFFYNEGARNSLTFQSADATKTFYLKAPEEDGARTSEEYNDDAYHFTFSTVPKT